MFDRNLSKYQAHKKIAGQYGCHWSSVYFWLTPSYRRHRTIYEKERQFRRSEKYWTKKKAWRKTYDRSYKWFRRHLLFEQGTEGYLLKIFDKGKLLSLQQISERLVNVAKQDPKIGRAIHLKRETLRKILESYQSNPARAPPIYEVRPGIYTFKKAN